MAVLAYFILGDKISSTQIIGAVLIIGGVCISSIKG